MVFIFSCCTAQVVYTCNNISVAVSFDVAGCRTVGVRVIVRCLGLVGAVFGVGGCVVEFVVF